METEPKKTTFKHKKYYLPENINSTKWFRYSAWRPGRINASHSLTDRSKGLADAIKHVIMDELQFSPYIRLSMRYADSCENSKKLSNECSIQCFNFTSDDIYSIRGWNCNLDTTRMASFWIWNRKFLFVFESTVDQFPVAAYN